MTVVRRDRLPTSAQLKQTVRFLADGLGHAVGFVVGPDDTVVFQIDPFPFERDDFATAAGKLELKADRQRDDEVL